MVMTTSPLNGWPPILLMLARLPFRDAVTFRTTGQTTTVAPRHHHETSEPAELSGRSRPTGCSHLLPQAAARWRRRYPAVPFVPVSALSNPPANVAIRPLRPVPPPRRIWAATLARANGSMAHFVDCLVATATLHQPIERG
jgi:hypothetical protein